MGLDLTLYKVVPKEDSNHTLNFYVSFYETARFAELLQHFKEYVFKDFDNYSGDNVHRIPVLEIDYQRKGCNGYPTDSGYFHDLETFKLWQKHAIDGSRIKSWKFDDGYILSVSY